MSDIKLYQGDCLELMKDIPDNSVDLVLVDLPYGTTACAWDVIIPFDELWKQYKRVAKDSTAFILFGCEPFSTVLRYSNLSWFKYDWIWHKNATTGFLNAKKQPLRDIEYISVFYKNQPTYNPQYTKGKAYTAQNKCGYVNKQVSDTLWNSYTMNVDVRYDNDGFRYPTQLLTFDTVAHNYTVHSTQKPVELLSYLIKTYTNEGDIVLDNCMGSGSTGVACIINDRNFIGIELDKNYFDIAEKRITNAKSGLFDFKPSDMSNKNNRNNKKKLF